jgi:hypothetical protein
MLENRSAETGYEGVMTNALVNEFVRHSDLQLSAADRADGFLGGVIESVGVQTISRTGLNTSLERQVLVLVRLALTDTAGRTLWSSRFSDQEAYAVAEHKVVTLDNRRRALVVLSGRMAEKMFYTATSEF